jgi:hypothetical protein
MRNRSLPARVSLWTWTGLASVAWMGAWFGYPDKVLYFGIPAILFLAVGALLTVRVRGNLIGPVLMVGASAWLFYDVGTAYAAASLQRGPFPAEYLAAWLGVWTGPIAYLMIPVLLVLFPDGSFTGRRRWFLPLFALALAITLIGAAMIWGLPAEALVDEQALKTVEDDAVLGLAFSFSWILAIPAALSLALRYRASTRLVRQQTKWLLASVLLAPAVGVLSLQFLDTRFEDLIVVVVVSTLPASIAVAVLRYRLYDLGRLVSRTVAYTLVIASLGALFAVSVVFIPNELMDSTAPSWLVAGSTLFVAALFNPIRRRIQTWVDRRFNRSRYDAASVMDRFASTLRDPLDPGDVIEGWLGVTTETMQPSSVGVWVR